MTGAGRRAGAAAAASLGALLSACATPPPADAPPSPRFTVLETLPAAGSVRADDLCPLEPGEWTFEQVEGSDAAAGTREVHKIAADERFGAAVSVAMGETRTEFRRPDADGNAVMPAVIDHGDRALTLFDPALVIAPLELRAGATHTSEAAMRVLDAANPRVRREAGRATRTARYVDQQRIVTPLGAFVAQRVEVSFLAELRLARAETASTFWVVPDVGVVALEHDERVRVLGIPAKSLRTRLVLISPN